MTANERDTAIATVQEALEHIQNILDKCRTSPRYQPDSAAARHLAETGHHMRFGCCARAA